MRAPGEDLVIKMWDTLIEKGIGALLRPWQMRREGKAATDVRVADRLRIAQAETDIEDIRNGRLRVGSREEMLLPPTGSEYRIGMIRESGADEGPRRLLAVASQISIVDAMRREVNVSKAILAAEDELKASESRPNAAGGGEEVQPDTDWLFRWRDAAGEVSAAELQRLWGQVLASEVKSPGSVSLRTVEFLRSISRTEAEEINALSRFAFDNFIYKGDLQLLADEGISLKLLFSMQHLGIIGGVDTSSTALSFSSGVSDSYLQALSIGSRVLGIAHPDPHRALTLPAFFVTRLGKEVFKLSSPKPSERYLRAVGKAIASEGYEVMLGDVATIDGNRIAFRNSIPLLSADEALE